MIPRMSRNFCWFVADHKTVLVNYVIYYYVADKISQGQQFHKFPYRKLMVGIDLYIESLLQCPQLPH